jgi:hypothetical protein
MYVDMSSRPVDGYIQEKVMRVSGTDITTQFSSDRKQLRYDMNLETLGAGVLIRVILCKILKPFRNEYACIKIMK